MCLKSRKILGGRIPVETLAHDRRGTVRIGIPGPWERGISPPRCGIPWARSLV
jgi:hypothetical protein